MTTKLTTMTTIKTVARDNPGAGQRAAAIQMLNHASKYAGKRAGGRVCEEADG